MARIKDEDYAYATARIRAKEIKLMSRSRLERLLDTADPSDAMKLLIESGYGSDHPEIGKGGENDIEMLLSGERKLMPCSLIFFPSRRFWIFFCGSMII